MANGNRLYNTLKRLKKDDILKLSLQRCKHGHTFIDHSECFKGHDLLNERVGFFDIETTNLVASYGLILSYCIKAAGGDVIKRVITPAEIRSKTKDKNLIADLCNDLRKFDRIITYYGSNFDAKFCRSRALLYGLDFPLYKEIKHTDVYYIVKHKLKLHSHRLEAVCDFFGIESKNHKMNPTVWHDAIIGDKEALAYVLKHNIEDVVSLEDLYNKMQGHFQINNRSI